MMNRNKPTIYAVTGMLMAGKTTFIKQCLTRIPQGRKVLVIQFEKGMESIQGDTLYIPIRDVQSQTDEELVTRIADAVTETQPSDIWVEWNGMLPVQRLITLLNHNALRRCCKLGKIIQVTEGQGYLEQLAVSGSMLMEQLLQCDVAVIRNVDRKQLRTIRRALSRMQGSVEAIAWEDEKQIDSLLGFPNVNEAVRSLTIFTACVALAGLFYAMDISIPTSISVFLGTWLQAIPFLLLGILLSSLIQVFVSADLIRRLFPKNLLGGMLFGIFGGFLMPICDCASIPVFRSLVKKGVPLPAAVTFMTAAPVINPVVMLSTYYAFGGNTKVVLARVVLGIIASVIIGLFFVRTRTSIFTNQYSAVACACCQTFGSEGMPASKLVQLVSHFRNELFEVGKYLLMGIAVSTFFQMVLGSDLTQMNALGLVGSMLLMMIMALLLSLCSSSDAVVGKNMGASFPIGAVMGFLVFGPMMDIKNLILMSANMTKRFIVKIAVVSFVVCFAVVYVASLLGLEGWLA